MGIDRNYDLDYVIIVYFYLIRPMSLNVKFGTWSFNAGFKSVVEFSKTIKDAEKALNDTIT